MTVEKEGGDSEQRLAPGPSHSSGPSSDRLHGTILGDGT